MALRRRVVGLLIRNNALLLVKGKGFPELWTPGGKIEEGEAMEATLKREFLEEVGLTVITMHFFKKYLMKNPYNENEMTETNCYLVEANGEPTPDHEIESIVWYTKQDADNKTYPMIEENEKGIIPDLINEGLLQ